MSRRRAGSRALVALNEQVSLLRWWRSDQGRRFGSLFMGDKSQKGLASHSLSIAAMEANKLNRARTYWITADMQAVISHAAETMPSQRLQANDLPSPYGFVWFEQVIEQLDRRGQPVSWRAMSWMPARARAADSDRSIPAVHLSFYTDVMDHAEGEFQPQSLPHSHHLTDAYMSDWMGAGNPRLLLLHEAAWAFGHDYHNVEFPDFDGQDPEVAARSAEAAEFYFLRFVAAMWTITQQRIAASSSQHIPRTVLRPAQDHLAVPAEIILVDLRRVDRPRRDAAGDAGEVMWTHRWWVDGHWRNQYLPSTGGHRLQWIDGFVKGPDDRPLILKDRIGRVVR